MSAAPLGARESCGLSMPCSVLVVVRLATYNIHAGIGEDGVFDLDRTIAALRGFDADVIGLQEVDVGWSERSEHIDEAATIGAALGMSVFFAPVYELEESRRYGPALLSRYLIVKSTSHVLTRLPSYFPATERERLPGFADITVETDAGPLRVLNTHLDYRPEPELRALQVQESIAIVGAAPTRTVLVGDLNAEPTAVELAPLLALFTDSLGDTGVGTFPASEPVKRIDYVAASPDLQVLAAHVVSDLVDASDHRAVVADIALPMDAAR